MKCTLFSTMLAVLCFAACSPGAGKKVKVMSSGKIQVDEATKTVTLTPGTQHNEAELTLTEKDKAVTVKSPEGDHAYEVPDNGVYILNLKTDTLIGNMVNFGNAGVPASISTEQLEHIIDSTQQLINGQNASDEKKTYFIVPKTIKKLTTNLNAQLINPYNNIPYKVEVDKDGKAPEIYKFFTARQKRESLNELIERMKK
ncbi:hypothetical protein FAM09_06140 [Niastella caeni]|uniref:DUF4369 domain-containing protein n=1 Tax=Niastella caeni TaxID=2569763 RepID=A0A4V4H1T0_9BACT|nr:hypothetical protein [Niastella caeni]THU41676.1 hypothetical protein FAM09_06140 [Niastella caeni]